MKMYVDKRYVNHYTQGLDYYLCPSCNEIKNPEDFNYNFISQQNFSRTLLCDNNVCFDCYLYKNVLTGLRRSITMIFKNETYQLLDIPSYFIYLRICICKIDIILWDKFKIPPVVKRYLADGHIKEKWLNINLKKHENMMPVNTKSMFAMLCTYMDKLDRNEIDVNQANAMSKLIGQANNLLMYELKRTVIMSNPELKANHRNLELKVFDSLPE